MVWRCYILKRLDCDSFDNGMGDVVIDEFYKDLIILALLGMNAFLCVWVMLLDGRKTDLERYIERMKWGSDD